VECLHERPETGETLRNDREMQYCLREDVDHSDIVDGRDVVGRRLKTNETENHEWYQAIDLLARRAGRCGNVSLHTPSERQISI